MCHVWKECGTGRCEQLEKMREVPNAHQILLCQLPESRLASNINWCAVRDRKIMMLLVWPQHEVLCQLSIE